jgi:hypothetical protein
MAMIADVFKVLLIDNVTKEEFATATLEEAGFTITSETKDVNGGGGLIAVLHSPRKENVTVTDPRFHFDILAKQLGADIVVGTGIGYAFPREYTVITDATDKIITLEQTPKTSSEVKIYKADGTTLVPTTDYTIVGSEVAFTGSIVAGDVVKVSSYKFDTSAESETIEINNKKYPNGVTCVLETLEISEDETPLNTIQIVFDKCVFDGEISISTKNDRDASRHNMNLRVLNKIGGDIAGRITRIPIS